MTRGTGLIGPQIGYIYQKMFRMYSYKVQEQDAEQYPTNCDLAFEFT